MNRVVGIDEVGRGCWAGPLVAGAVVLAEPLMHLKDSKQLTKKQRQELSVAIYASAAAVGLGWVSASEIDDLGLTEAVRTAMQRAMDTIAVQYDEVIIDGNINFLINNPKARALIKADQTIPEVSAASIVAKVARDTYMVEETSHLPDYGFEKHVGYGTALHLERLQKFGVSDMHRRSFKPVSALLQ